MWADTPEMLALVPEDAYRITRKKAIKLCIRENERRKYERSNSGYASNTISPVHHVVDSDILDDGDYYLGGYIWERA